MLYNKFTSSEGVDYCMLSPDLHEVSIYDWDKEGTEVLRDTKFRLLDTTLRDGAQTPGITQPNLEQKLAIIDFNAKIGIEATDICLPVVGGQYFKEGVACASYINSHYPDMEPVVLTRTLDNDVDATLKFYRECGGRLSSILFRGTSDLRLLAEDWNEDDIAEAMYRHARTLTAAGVNVICATEDTTRTRPEFLERVFLAGKEGGAREFCIADTAGYATPWAVEQQTKWVKNLIGNDDLHIQFHGHDDSENAVANSIAAIRGGANTLHVTYMGIGERCGNASLEGFLSNLMGHGIFKYDATHAMEANQHASAAFGRPIPPNHPGTGEVAFTSESGIHGAAIVKADEKGRKDIAGLVYSNTDARWWARNNTLTIGPLSGVQNARSALHRLGLAHSDSLEATLLAAARLKGSTLRDIDIVDIARGIENDEEFIKRIINQD